MELRGSKHPGGMTFSKAVCLTIIFLSALHLTACTSLKLSMADHELQATEIKLKKFSSAKELRKYVDKTTQWKKAEKDHKWQLRLEEYKRKHGHYPPKNTQFLEEIIVTAQKREETSITNNQVGNVDEGDIVKKVGRHLVLLRRGRLFSLNIGTDSDTVLSVTDWINAYPPMLKHDAWYDEMLVYSNTIIVLGYSYDLEAAELGFFSINDLGELEHTETFFIRAFDYYSTSNYASRLVEGKLVFYLPQDIDNSDTMLMPTITSVNADGTLSAWKPLYEAYEIYQPVQHSLHPVMHSVAVCALNKLPFSCTASSVAGPESRSFFVSADSVYLWVDGDNWALDYRQTGYWDMRKALTMGSYKAWTDKPASVLYKIPIGDGVPEAIHVRGSPIDQFSFSETEKELQVLTRELSDSDGMYNSRRGIGKFHLARIPHHLFSQDITELKASYYTPLPSPQGEHVTNRFINDDLLYAVVDEEYNNGNYNYTCTLVVHGLDQQTVDIQFDLDYPVTRIEKVGSKALLIGPKPKYELVMSTVRLTDTPAVFDSHYLSLTEEADDRSHGFNYTKWGDGHLLGLSIYDIDLRDDGESRYYSDYQPARMLYYQFNDDFSFNAIGSLDGRLESVDIEDNCEVSCEDWYGMARPIFIGDRVFALLGYELIEGSFDGLSLYEKQRINVLSD